MHYEELPFGHLSFQIAEDMTYFTETTMALLAKYNGKEMPESTDEVTNRII